MFPTAKLEEPWDQISTFSRMAPFTDPETGSHVHVHQGVNPPSSCTWSHTSTVSGLTPLPFLVPGSHIQSPVWPHVSGTAPGVTWSQSPMWLLSSTWGHTSVDSRVTSLLDPAAGVTHPVSSMTPPHQTFYLSLLGLSLQGYPISQTLYLGSHAHGGQDDSLPQRLYLVSHGHSHQGYPNFQTLYLGSHKHSLQGEPLTDTPPGVTYPQSQSDSSKILYLGSQVQSPGWLPPRPWTLGHMSRVSCVMSLPRHNLWSQVHRLQCDPLPRLCNWDHMSSVSSVTPPLIICTWGEVSTVSRVKPLARPCTCIHTSTISRMTAFPYPAAGFTCPQSPAWTPFHTLHLGSHVHIIQGDTPWRPFTCG